MIGQIRIFAEQQGRCLGRSAVSLPVLHRPLYALHRDHRHSVSTSSGCSRSKPAPVHKFEQYSPKVVEADWYDWWQRRGLFKPKPNTDQFSMLLPPPNVTGVLHIGHALTLSIQDAIARWNRMHGRSVNWVPGTDHAGISTQSVVEKQLMRKTRLTRHEVGREYFTDMVWEWKQKHGQKIMMQTRRIGASVDWDQEYFTMDDKHSQVVRDAFIQLFDDGMVYRDTRMVNWSCAVQSVISDIEAMETTRPETMLGDVALAVNSNDPRYKITPAHDENDYACAQRLKLPVVPVFLPDGTVVKAPQFAKFLGMTRWEVRRRVIHMLTASKAYKGNRDAEASVINRCSRSGDIIEPMLMPQWYVRCGEMAKRADQMVQTGEMRLIPGRQRVIWHNWMSGINDWCVSRQLWWGHRIPLYRVSWTDSRRKDVWVAAKSEQHAREKALLSLAASDSTAKADSCEISSVTQDEDVLDTWFSSGLLPLTVFKPEAAAAAGKPLSSVLETGQDILFFWVARMAMLCTYFVKVPPFSKVLLHPMVRDSQGRKMSKSLGNIIDPMDVIDGAVLGKLLATLQRGFLSRHELAVSDKEIRKLYPTGFQQFGTDALRLTLILYTQQTQQINMSLDNVKASYHFCNKLWNTFRFVQTHASQRGVLAGDSWSDGIAERLSVFDRGLLSRLHQMLREYQRAMKTYRLAAAAEAVRDFVQRDLCDRYIEICKLSLFGKQYATRQELWQQQQQQHASGCDMSIMEKVWEQPGLCGVVKHDAQAEAENEASIYTCSPPA
ncbi:hypothetical protein LPJ53_004317 [Coemansia erecta]|uniref:valine--tRNA ligase n=1 Tax=Coemansia erecta TaxID=147472 RepID=A0A9W7XY82_9FUNG|nr:hypothetical protein LPJ53_004317 [Coemansia erecta]